MAGPRHNLGGTDRLGSAISDRVASRPDAEHLAEQEVYFGQTEASQSAMQGLGSSASSDQTALGAAREGNPPIGNGVLARYIYNPTEVSFLKQLLNQR